MMYAMHAVCLARLEQVDRPHGMSEIEIERDWTRIFWCRIHCSCNLLFVVLFSSSRGHGESQQRSRLRPVNIRSDARNTSTSSTFNASPFVYALASQRVIFARSLSLSCVYVCVRLSFLGYKMLLGLSRLAFWIGLAKGKVIVSS